MRKNITLFILLAGLCGCQRQCASVNRNFQTSPRHYQVTMYSGGNAVFRDTFYGIINDSRESDGCYYYKGDMLVEISGDYIITSDK